jgi:hypothetical protein
MICRKPCPCSKLFITACAIANLDFAFTEARKGGAPFLPKDGGDIINAKAILQRLQPHHGFALAANR